MDMKIIKFVCDTLRRLQQWKAHTYFSLHAHFEMQSISSVALAQHTSAFLIRFTAVGVVNTLNYGTTGV